MASQNNVKVAVCMITYNHANFITQAIESVLSQQASFDFRLYIGEDGSRDGTLEICQDFAKRYPDQINLVTSTQNVGMMNNLLRTYKSCEGEYIAFIEGDDYWTDNLKLQKQIDFLDSDQSYIACFHNVLLKMERMNRNEEWLMHKTMPKDTFGTEDILGPWLIHSASLIFRNKEKLELPPWFQHCRFGDLAFFLLLSLKGKFKYLEDVMAVYRRHDGGITTQFIGWDKITALIFIYENFNIHTGYRYKAKVREAVIYEIKENLPDSLKPPVQKKNMLRRLASRLRRVTKL